MERVKHYVSDFGNQDIFDLVTREIPARITDVKGGFYVPRQMVGLLFDAEYETKGGIKICVKMFYSGDEKLERLASDFDALQNQGIITRTFLEKDVILYEVKDDWKIVALSKV